MANDLVTVYFEGEITNRVFSRSVSNFVDLVDALTVEVADSAQIKWVLADLQAPNFLATSQGIPTNESDMPRVGRVADAYLEVGHALERDAPIPYSYQVQKPAIQLRALLNHNPHTLRFETNLDEVVIAPGEGSSAPLPAVHRVAYGAVTGRVQTLSNRGILRFTLYDTIWDRAVSCYLEEGHEAIMRDAWGRLAVVEGVVRRDPMTGKASDRPAHH